MENFSQVSNLKDFPEWIRTAKKFPNVVESMVDILNDYHQTFGKIRASVLGYAFIGKMKDPQIALSIFREAFVATPQKTHLEVIAKLLDISLEEATKINNLYANPKALSLEEIIDRLEKE